MPQMAPIMWINLMSSVLVILIVMMTMMYFSVNSLNKLNYKKMLNINKKKMMW